MMPEEQKSKISLTKKSKNTENADLFGAFDFDDTLTFILKAPREIGACSPYAEFYRDDDAEHFELPFIWTGRDKSDPSM